jgi:antitoxin MazE
MATTVQKWGNSLGIRVPKDVAEQTNLKNGTEIEFDTSGGILTVRPKRRRRGSKYKLIEMLGDLLGKTKGPSPHRDLDRDPPVGRELI